MIVQALLVTVGKYTDTRDREHEFDRDLIIDLAINSSRWLNAGFEALVFGVGDCSLENIYGRVLAFSLTLDGCGLVADLMLWREPEYDLKPGMNICFDTDKRLNRIAYVSLNKVALIKSARFLSSQPTLIC
jgi:hypothetical protein